MCNYSYYITPEEYLKASEIGISARVLEERIRRYGWNKKRAITTPLRAKRKKSIYVDIALRNGIKRSTFDMRIKAGWLPGDASTIPAMTSKQILDFMHSKKVVYSKEIKELCKKNGICKSTFTNRVNKLKWPLMKAATAPPNKKATQNRPK